MKRVLFFTESSRGITEFLFSQGMSGLMARVPHGEGEDRGG